MYKAALQKRAVVKILGVASNIFKCFDDFVLTQPSAMLSKNAARLIIPGNEIGVGLEPTTI